MRVSKGLGFAGVSAVVGAVVMIPAAASAGTTYNSTATGTAGSVSVAGNDVPIPDNSVTATDQTGPQAAELGIGSLESAIPSSAGPLATALKAALPNGANLVTETATAASNGQSTACAGFLLTGDCTANGKPQPLTIDLSLADLPGLNNLPAPPSAGANKPAQSDQQSNSPASDLQSGVSGAASQLGSAAQSAGLPAGATGSTSSTGSGASASANQPAASSTSSSSTSSSNPLSAFTVVISLTGPQAACTAGPDGSSGSNFTATQSLASVSLDIQQNGKSVLPNGPITLNTSSDNILSGLPTSGLTASLQSALQSAGISSISSAADALPVTINPGSTSGVGKGPETTATAGELAISASGTQLLDVKGAQATCGPNKAAVAAATTPAAKTTSSEQPLGGGIQTDEGRSGSGSDPALWAGMAGAGVLGGTASGLTLWRRRRNAL